MALDLTEIDNTWTLFLDRDGVINHEKHLDYIHTWDEFKFYDGAKVARNYLLQKGLMPLCIIFYKNRSVNPSKNNSLIKLSDPPVCFNLLLNNINL